MQLPDRAYLEVNRSDAECGTGECTRPSWPLALALAVLVFFTTWFYIHNVPLGEPPDEWAQLSYVADITSGGPLIPDYSASRIINSGNLNYLQHPPLYYTLLGTPGRILGWSATKDFWRYRLISALMVSLGMFFWALTCANYRVKPLTNIALCISTLAIPMFPYLAGSINNDNLCYLGIAVSFYGISLASSTAGKSAYIVAAGLLITFFAKATGSFFLLAFLATWTILDSRRMLSFTKEKHVRAAALIVTIGCAAYYIPTLIIYHTPFPVPGTLYANTRPPTHPVGIFEFTGTFVSTMVERLPIILSSHNSYPIQGWLKDLFYWMLALPILAWACTRPFMPPSPLRKVSDAFIIGLALTIAMNLRASWSGYVHTGLYAGIQPRYYSFALPGVFLFLFHGGEGRRLGKGLIYLFALLAITLLSLIPPNAAVAHYTQAWASRTSHLSAKGMPNEFAAGNRNADVSGKAGFLDRIELQGNTARLSGWAIDATTKSPAKSLWVRLEGHLLGAAQPLFKRPDVARILNSPAAEDSGFTITVSDLKQGTSTCDFSIEAEQRNGSLVPLKNSACAPVTKVPSP